VKKDEVTKEAGYGEWSRVSPPRRTCYKGWGQVALCGAVAARNRCVFLCKMCRHIVCVPLTDAEFWRSSLFLLSQKFIKTMSTQTGLHSSISVQTQTGSGGLVTPVAGSIFRPLSQTHISKREFKNEILRSALLDIQLTLFCVCGVMSFLP